jgi:DNA-binding Lrp family transcriptional regulator
MKLDKIDKKIIEELKIDSSQSLKILSKKTGVRPSTIHQRIKKLKDEKVINYTIKTDDDLVGENFVVFMMVETDKMIENKVFDDSHIKEVYGITGEYDLMIKMKFKDVKEFNSFIIEFRKKYELKKTLTMVATANIKD